MAPDTLTRPERVVSHDPRRKTPSKVECACEMCGKAFFKFPAAIRDGRGRYCSRACLWQANGLRAKGVKRIPRYGKDNPNWRGRSAEKQCPICNHIYNGVGKTCSVKCGRAFRAKTISGNGNPFRKAHPPKLRTCHRCQKQYALSQGGGRFYCSGSCYLKARRISLRQLNIAGKIEDAGFRVELERRWEWLRSPRTRMPLRVDIYLPDQNVAIEYDGRHHKEHTFSKSKEGLDRIIQRDAEKDALLSEHGIPLLRVSGWPVALEDVLRFIKSSGRNGTGYGETDIPAEKEAA